MQGFLQRVGGVAMLAVAIGLSGAAVAESATFGPCPGGQRGTTCRIWTGKVTFVGDGDTLSVDVKGDGTRKPLRVRLIGVQAMEEHVYTSDPEKRVGECHANEATARVEQLLEAGKSRVRLAARARSSQSRKRPLRQVAVRIGGKWRDVGRALVKEGHALVLSSRAEYAWNRSYNSLAQRAVARRRNLWDPEYCGAGPAANVRILAFADPEGADVDGEWVKLTNLDPVKPLSLANWWLRDSALHFYVFGPDAVLAPSTTLTVWVGDGFGNAGNLFWDSQTGIFDNPREKLATGDGAFLFDPDGDLRAAFQYPCRVACADPLAGRVSVRVKYRGTEYVTFKNVGDAAIDLENYRVESRPHTYVFDSDALLQPGESLRLYTRGTPEGDTHARKHWGLGGTILNNGGDHVALTNLRFTRIACKRWGSGTCGTPLPRER